jgi:hypothetical protein
MMSQDASPLQQRLSRKDIQQARLKRLSDWMERLTLPRSPGDWVEIIPTFNLTISPQPGRFVAGLDDGIWREMTLIPFQSTPPAALPGGYEEC